MSKPSLYSDIETKFEAMSRREQTLIFYAVPLLIIVVIFLLMIEPTFVGRDALAKRINNAQLEIDMAEQSLNVLRDEVSKDPDEVLKQEIRVAEKKVSILNDIFNNQLDELVPASVMPILLEQLLAQTGAVELLEMTSIPPVNVFADQQDKADLELYPHGLELVLKGDYFAIRQFLIDAENLGWQLYWRDLNYQVADYPMADISLTIFTLSTNKEFIRVD